MATPPCRPRAPPHAAASRRGLLSPPRLLSGVCTFEPGRPPRWRGLSAPPIYKPQPPGSLLPPGLEEDVTGTGGISLYPHRHGLDGFFMALWHKD